MQFFTEEYNNRTMTLLSEQPKESLSARLGELKASYKHYREQSLSLDITRGKPSAAALSLSNDILNCLTPEEIHSAAGLDCRNYGVLDGIPEAKALFAPVLKADPSEIIVGGNSSLTLMHDLVARAYSHGFFDSSAPFSEQKVKAICPVPGYDRHFSICQHFGIEMLTVEMDDEGPIVSQIEELAANDDSVKLLWMVPKYSNPCGRYYSSKRIKELASLNVKANDFKIICDDAYAVHHWSANPQPEQTAMLKACQEAGNPNRCFVLGSTSKITFSGAGVAFMAAHKENADWVRSHLFVQTIGADKINMLRHVKFLKDFDGIKAHMKKHAALMMPKFNAVTNALQEHFGGKGVASWTSPEGGYFISLDVMEGCATKVFELAKDSGLKLTPAGATYPYKNDPKDSNIRIAPSVPPLETVEAAMQLLCVCIEIACIEKILGN